MGSIDQDSDLSRDLGLFALFTTATGTMIGAGIFILPGPAAAVAGPASAVSFGLAGLIALVATMCAVELATAMPRAGGPYFFVSRSMGPMAGAIVGLGAWIALIFKGSFALVGLGQYVVYFTPVPVLVVAAVGGLLLIILNWVGAEKSGALQNVVVIGLIVILGVFAGQGLIAFETGELMPFVPLEQDEGWIDGLNNIITATGLVFISYLGIVKATAVAGEVKDPGTTLPRALFAAVVFVTLLYVIIMLVITGLMPLDDIAAAEAPVAEAGERVLGGIGGAVIAAAGILATVSTANAAVLSSSRFPFAMSRDGLMPPQLRASSERFGTPTLAIWVTGLVMIALAVVFDVEGLAKMGGTFGILVFALLNVTVVLLRSSNPDWYDPDFEVPLSPVLPLIGAAAALLLIPFMGLLSQISAIVFIIVGIGWYYYQSGASVGEQVEPGHDLTDQFQRIDYREAVAEKEALIGAGLGEETNIIVEIAAGKPNREFLKVVEQFGRQLNATIDIIVVAEVPPQIPLDEYEHDIDLDWLDKLQGRLEEVDSPVEFDLVRARDKTSAVLNRVGEGTELVIADWHDPIRKYHLQESHIDEILRSDVPVRVAVLKNRGLAEIDEIVVATERGPYDRAEVELADALAVGTDARLVLVKVLETGASDEAVDTGREYLERLVEIVESPVETELIQHDDVREALIQRGDDADLLVLGAPSPPDHIRDFFGRTTDIVATETKTSLLVAKDPEQTRPWYRRVWRKITGL